ncbi:MAG: hypothetical protein AAF561_13330 [Planctomycetota bacterium]
MHGEDPYSIPGKYVVPALMLFSVLTVILGFAIVRPPEGFEPAPTYQRPFGPAELEDVTRRPLIEKGQLREFARERNGEADPVDEAAPTTRPATP